MEKENSKQYIVSMTPTLYEQATQKAKDTDRTFAAYVRELVTKDLQDRRNLLAMQGGRYSLRLSLGSMVKVKLLPEGYQQWKAAADKIWHHNDAQYIMPLSYYQEQADKQGYVEFTLAHFIFIFGPDFNWVSPPFEQTVVIEADFPLA